MDSGIFIDTDQISFRYSESHQANGEYDLHCHNFYEVYFFLDGNVDYLVEGQHYKPSPYSLLLLSPHVFHGVRVNTDAPYCRFALHFHPDILSPSRRSFLLSVFPSPDRTGAQIYFENTKDYRILDCFEAVEDCGRKSGKLRVQLLPICVEALLARIVSMAFAENSPQEETRADTIADILLYLNRHLQEPVTLDQLSAKFFISKHHLNKVFRRATGTTVFEYLLHKRVILAQELLIDGCSAQEAASRSGFRDYSSFYRAYKRILGHSPLKDRGVLPPLSSSAAEKFSLVGLKKEK